MNPEEAPPPESDNESNSSNSSSVPRTRLSQSRIAKKSTGRATLEPPANDTPVTRRQAAIVANREKQRFLGNFNPDTSDREKRKLDKKLQQSLPILPPPPKKIWGQVYDHRGVHINSGEDMCDCMEMQCPGCFFQCPKCNSSKCGSECRVNRRARYESIEYHGYNFIKKNPIEK